MENRILAVVCLSITLMSCMGAKEQPPAISDISNADSLVRVQSSWFSKGGQIAFPSLDKVQLEGDRGCSQFGKPAIMLSGRCVARSEAGICWTREYLFACRTPEGEEMAGRDTDDETVDQLVKKILEETKTEKESSVRTELEARQSESERNAEYTECIRRFPADWCHDWHHSDAPAAGGDFD